MSNNDVVRYHSTQDESSLILSNDASQMSLEPINQYLGYHLVRHVT